MWPWVASAPLRSSNTSTAVPVSVGGDPRSVGAGVENFVVVTARLAVADGRLRRRRLRRRGLVRRSRRRFGRRPSRRRFVPVRGYGSRHGWTSARASALASAAASSVPSGSASRCRRARRRRRCLGRRWLWRHGPALLAFAVKASHIVAVHLAGIVIVPAIHRVVHAVTVCCEEVVTLLAQGV